MENAGPEIEISINIEDRPEPDVVATLRSWPPAVISDALQRRYAMHGRIRCLSPKLRFAGVVLPVWTRAGDNVAVHKAIALARPGDVLVVDGQSDETRALAGELMSRQSKAVGIAAMVIDGAFRDVDSVDAIGLPVYAVATTPAGPFKSGPGAIGLPVSCGGVVCSYGDIAVGDRTGVVIVPRRMIDRTLEKVPAILTAEDDIRSNVARAAL